MKQRLFIAVALVAIIVLMIGLNTASYVRRVQEPDKEVSPNRSSYHPGVTGSLAFYTLLAETGRPVTRWQMSLDQLAAPSAGGPATMIMIGPFRKEFSTAEGTEILKWVEGGGRLVLIDREPPRRFIDTFYSRTMSVAYAPTADLLRVDPADRVAMTLKMAAAVPRQPTIITAGVNAVQHSRFAGGISFERTLVGIEDFDTMPAEVTGTGDPSDAGDADDAGDTVEPYDFFESGQPPPPAAVADQGEYYTGEIQPPPPPAETPTEEEYDQQMVYFAAPIVHFADADKNIAVEWAYGEGSILAVSDPYIVSNGGIGLADNVQFAVNLAGDGLVAFNEYHHGFGSERNRFLEYFAGTPAFAIFLQVVGLAALVLYSQSRRFARPIAEPESDRLTKLEYVSAMAELQRRTRAYDLAMENIFTDFRRRVTRFVGVDNRQTPRQKLAQLIAARTEMNADELATLFAKCEAIVHGEPTREREILSLTSRLREIEESLGIMRRGRSKLN